MRERVCVYVFSKRQIKNLKYNRFFCYLKINFIRYKTWINHLFIYCYQLVRLIDRCFWIKYSQWEKPYFHWERLISLMWTKPNVLQDDEENFTFENLFRHPGIVNMKCDLALALFLLAQDRHENCNQRRSLLISYIDLSERYQCSKFQRSTFECTNPKSHWSFNGQQQLTE